LECLIRHKETALLHLMYWSQIHKRAVIFTYLHLRISTKSRHQIQTCYRGSLSSIKMRIPLKYRLIELQSELLCTIFLLSIRRIKMKYLIKLLSIYGSTHIAQQLGSICIILSYQMEQLKQILRSNNCSSQEDSDGRLSRMIRLLACVQRYWKWQTLMIRTKWGKVRHKFSERIWTEKISLRSLWQSISILWWHSLEPNKAINKNLSKDKLHHRLWAKQT